MAQSDQISALEADVAALKEQVAGLGAVDPSAFDKLTSDLAELRNDLINDRNEYAKRFETLESLRSNERDAVFGADVAPADTKSPLSFRDTKSALARGTFDFAGAIMHIASKVGVDLSGFSEGVILAEVDALEAKEASGAISANEQRRLAELRAEHGLSDRVAPSLYPGSTDPMQGARLSNDARAI